MELIKCPNCDESYYQENYSITTCLGWTPIYKNGVLINENPNVSTTYCTCLNCGNNFSYSSRKNSKPQTMSASLDNSISRTPPDITAMPVLQ